MNLFKKLFVSTDETKEITAYESWMVRWNSVNGSGRFPDKTAQSEVFTNEEDAKIFKKTLEEAIKFTKSDYDSDIKITKN